MANVATVNFPAQGDVIIAGDTWPGFSVTMTDEDDAPISLTGIVIRMQGKMGTADYIDVSTTESTITVSSNTFTVLPIEMPRTPGVIEYDVQFTYGDGTVTTWQRGQIKLTKDITD
jgi:hypothetical protein